MMISDVIRRTIVAAAISLAPTTLPAQAVLRAADSSLVGRILLAEDRRDTSDAALAEGIHHADLRIALLARRARARIADARFATRDSFPALPAPRAWPEPAWKTRYRQLAQRRTDCDALHAALSDSVLPVRLRAIDLTGGGCAVFQPIAATLRSWVDALGSAGPRAWHAGAHALVALARVRPGDARPRIRTLTSHRQWQVRMYAARAAGIAGDSAMLRTLARDADDNVKEAAIEGLSRLTGHLDDDVYLAALGARGAQAVRAAALALKGSPRADVAAAANAAFGRWVARANQSERDARVALLEAAGRPASDDRVTVPAVELPRNAVALALGADVRLRVTMAPPGGEGGGGGGSFVVRLRGDVAPIMAARVFELARRGYYNGTSWHRVEHDFVVQGGGPGANEYVGHPQFFRDELGTVPHARGTVGMSTRGHDTGDAQWFINLRDNLRLGRDYTVFAEIVEGMDVVDRILEGDVIARVSELGTR